MIISVCIKVKKYKAIEKKNAKALQKQVLEPMGALLVVHDKRRNIYKYVGFENGEAISRGNPKFSKFPRPTVIKVNVKFIIWSLESKATNLPLAKKQISEKKKKSCQTYQYVWIQKMMWLKGYHPSRCW